MKQWLYFENKQTKKQQTESLNEIGQWDWKLKQNSVGSSTASYPLLGWNTEVLLYFVQSILEKKKKNTPCWRSRSKQYNHCQEAHWINRCV